MADVKWIKLAIDVFDNRKIRQIEAMPDGDAVVLMWFKLLCLAGNVNDKGYIYFTPEMPYTDQMLANHFNKPLTTVQLALSIFQHFQMIDIVDDIIHVSSWEKYQNVDSMEKMREQNRIRKQRQRSKELQPATCPVTCHVTVTQCHATDKDIDKDKDIDRDKDSPPYNPPKGTDERTQSESLAVETAAGAGNEKPVDHSMTYCDQRFTEFWAAYPKKSAKAQLKKLLKKSDLPPKYSTLCSQLLKTKGTAISGSGKTAGISLTLPHG